MRAARSVDVLVIGAGRAGLAAGYWLAQTRRTFMLVDGAARIGDSWRRRWDSLTLFTPAAYSALPGLKVPGDADAYPTKDQIADYLESYAEHFQLPVQLGARVTRLERRNGQFAARLASGGEVASGTVIVATGAFQLPAVPTFAAHFDLGVAQYTPNTYRNPRSMPAGTVLIVGDGATGRLIGLELAASRRVLLATGRPRRTSPERILGRSLFWWLDKLGILRASRDSRIGRWLMEVDPFPGRHLRLDRLAAHGVLVKPRVAWVAGNEATFADGTNEQVSSVVWSTGYRDDAGWVAVTAALDERGGFRDSGGMSPIRGLFHVGRNWQRDRGSALLLGVGDDARRIVDALDAATTE